MFGIRDQWIKEMFAKSEFQFISSYGIRAWKVMKTFLAHINGEQSVAAVENEYKLSNKKWIVYCNYYDHDHI